MLSPADLATYRRDGFIVLPDILTREEVEGLRPRYRGVRAQLALRRRQ